MPNKAPLCLARPHSMPSKTFCPPDAIYILRQGKIPRLARPAVLTSLFSPSTAVCPNQSPRLARLSVPTRPSPSKAIQNQIPFLVKPSPSKANSMPSKAI